MDWLAEAEELAATGEPFALVTVVRRVAPASAQPGAKALIRRDGSMHGWVGGSCAQPVVVNEARQALQEGRPRLLRLGHFPGATPESGVVEHPMTCHSGGALEILIEPVLPAPHLVIVGSTPVATTLAELAKVIGYRVTDVASGFALKQVLAGPVVPGFVVVATMGVDDETALLAALHSGTPYVALVASPKRSVSVRETLAGAGLSSEAMERLKVPAGLDLGASTQEEIALSILAEIVQARAAMRPAIDPGVPPTSPGHESAVEAVDPVCGMSVMIAGAQHVSEFAGRIWYFCCGGCKAQFDAHPGDFAAT